ncbi:MAG: amidohydrolase [Gammaproteobacteria bacterium]
MHQTLTTTLAALLLTATSISSAVTTDADILPGATKATLLLRGGRIHTPAGVVESMAVDSRGVIVAVGTTAQIEKLADRSTKVIELGGHAVLPGFHDMHVHPVFAGLQARKCVVPQGSGLQQIQRIVKECVSRARPGEWITGGQWDASAVGRPPNRKMLDSVAPQNPVLLGDTSEHSAWANSKALEIAGVTRATSAPQGGIIERDASGEATGVLREGAVELVRQHVPEPTEQEVRAALEWSSKLMLSYGITSFTEAAVGYASGLEKALDAYAALTDSGVLKQRIRLCIPWEPGSQTFDSVVAARNLYARDRLSPDCIKIFLDGVPTDSHTAAMLEPYEGTVAGRADEASQRGILMVEQQALNAAVARFDRMGLAVKFHAAGDAAVRAGLNAIEAARKENGYSGRLHDVGHCTFVAKSDLQRARAIGATYEVSPYLWSPSPINDDITKAVGAERIARVWPVREMIDSGALVVPGSDWSVVPSVNPWLAVEMLVTREGPGGSKTSFGKAEAITLDEALNLFTINSARHVGVANTLGQLQPGMLADLVVLNQDPFSVPATSLHQTTVLKTLINGEVVYERAP